MSKGRMEAFSDAVLAIIITIMVLEFVTPEEADLHALAALLPKFLSYTLSFVFVGIYWNNHHHLLQVCNRVGGGVLWANMHLLFWLSLVPFATAWTGEHPGTSWPAALYGIIMLGAAIAYTILTFALISLHGRDSKLATAMGKDVKGKASLVMYLTAIPLAFVNPWLSYALYVGNAILWLIPDRRIEHVLAS